MKAFHDKDIEKIALRLIGTVDYDIEKEVTWNLEEDGYDDLLNEMKQQVLMIINEARNG